MSVTGAQRPDLGQGAQAVRGQHSLTSSLLVERVRGVGCTLSRFGALTGLLLLCVALSLLSPHFLTVENLFNILRQSTVISLVAIGQLLAILTAGIDLSVGSVMALSMVIVGTVAVKWQLHPMLAMFLGLLTGAGLGFINGFLLTRLRLPHPFISTLGMQNIARGLALIITASTPISGFPPLIRFLGAESIGIVPVAVLFVFVVYGIFHVFLNHTILGRHIYAVGGNREAARLSGVRVDSVLVWVYTLSGFMTAVAGIVLIGRVNSAFPLAGLGYDLDSIAAVIIGGASFFGGEGTVWGTLIGALIMAVLRNGLNLLNVSPDWQTVAIGAVIILAVYVDVLRRQRLGRPQKAS